MPAVRELTQVGIDQFRQYLVGLSTGASDPPPRHLLTGEDTSAPLAGNAEVEERIFASKREAAEYLVSCLAGLDRVNVDHNSGLWSWLSLFYFDQVCPPSGHGVRRPGQIERHIPTG